MNRQFTNAITQKADQMQDGQRQAVRAAIKSGAQLLSLSRYSETGNLVLRVTVPDTWHGVNYDRFRDRGLYCLIPTSCEQETQAWYAKHTR